MPPRRPTAAARPRPIPTLAALALAAGSLDACTDPVCDAPPPEALTVQNVLAPIAWWRRITRAVVACPATPTPQPQISPPGAIAMVTPANVPVPSDPPPPGAPMVVGGAPVSVAPQGLPLSHARHRTRH